MLKFTTLLIFLQLYNSYSYDIQPVIHRNGTVLFNIISIVFIRFNFYIKNLAYTCPDKRLYNITRDAVQNPLNSKLGDIADDINLHAQRLNFKINI